MKKTALITYAALLCSFAMSSPISAGILPPDIAVSPDSLSDTLLTGASSVQYLTIENTGLSDLVWEINLGKLGLETMTFTKEDTADWTLPENQDRITDNVWITRADREGIFNAATETSYSWDSPHDTEWAYGLTEELAPEDYRVWRDAVGGHPPGMVGQPISLHLITDDIYFDVMFHSWTCCGQGGGFSYTRSYVRPVWLSVSQDSGVVVAGASQQVAVTFDATGLDAGGHDAVIVLNSNDPDEGVISIPVHLDVTSASDIYTAIDSLDFGQVFVNYADSLELVVENKGTQDLLITSVVVEPAEYTISPTFAGIDPDGSETFLVIFAPVAVSDYPGTLTFTTTDPDEGTYVITLLGEGVEPPIVGVSPDSLTADLFTNDTVQQVLTINNTGASDLIYEIWAVATSPGEPEAQSSVHERTTSTVTASGTTSRSIKDLLGDLLPKSQLQEVKDSPVRIVAATSQTIAGNPVWRLLYTDPDEPSFEPDVENVYGAPTLEEVLFKVNTYEPLSGEDYYSLIIIIDADQDNSTGLDIDDLIGYGWQLGADYLIIFLAGPGESYGELLRFVSTPSGWVFEELDSLTTMVVDLEANEIILGVNAQHLEDYSAINFGIEAYLGVIDLVPDQGAGHIAFPLSPPWLRLSAAGGVIPAGGYEDVTVTFDATALFGGDYLADILVVSNDPVTPELPVPTRLGVTGIPIYAGPDTVDFGISYIGYVDSTYLKIDNTGTDVLEITSIVSGDPQLTLTPATLSIPPVSSDTLVMYLLTDTGGEFATTVSFSTNDDNSPEVTLPMVSSVIVAPDISVTPMELSFSDTVDEVLSDTISISNGGGSDLAWEIQLEGIGLGTVTFTKKDYADWTLPENQDRITDNVWITRANTQGIFNAATEIYYNWNSPDDTEWAYGLTA
ncbi:MAG: choice-of-anchor D domain-containing protein [Calditrichaeota bacterium]|nr:choice-of-anchor D domain-containing protein [Calditrichota bacterium]